MLSVGDMDAEDTLQLLGRGTREGPEHQGDLRPEDEEGRDNQRPEEPTEG